MFKDKTILITGAGSLGRALTQRLLEQEPKAIRLLDNHEATLFDLQQELSEYDNILRFLVGDITDRDRVSRAMDEVDYVFHTAALKHVPYSNYSPWSYVNANVRGTMVVVDTAINANVEKVMVVSTDKAAGDINNIYGATKRLAEGIAVAANYYKGNRKTTVSIVRYGNVEGSCGSVIPTWKSLIEEGKQIVVTAPEMTRFTISMDEALDFILQATELSRGGEIFVPYLKAYRLGDLLEAVIRIDDERQKHAVRVKTGAVRPGERIYETLISRNEIRNSHDLDSFYAILPDAENIEMFNLPCSRLQIFPRPSFTEYNSSIADKYTVDELVKRVEGLF